jgi:hypothetical protein
MVKKVVRRLHYSEEYCYGSGSVLIGSRSQAATSIQTVRRLNIPNRDHHLLMPPLFIVFQQAEVVMSHYTQ